MDPFELETWNMFSNDFVGTESDTLLPDELMEQQQLQQQQTQVRNDGDCVNASDLLPDVKCEPIDESQTEEEREEANASCMKNETQGKATMPDSEYDDNAIFNFGLETLNADTPSKMEETRGPHLRQRDKLNSTNLSNEVVINYEAAVVYICPACGAEFDVQTLWKRHINAMHSFNTRRGLNFVPIDKLYHRCLECHKRIAMHAMENLLKHKFTHLPYRCTKCKICLRLYKYRQDLMVHLRTVHRDELLVMSSQPHSSSYSGITKNKQRSGCLEIKDIQENAIDIFEGTLDDNIKVKNEILDDSDTHMDDNQNDAVIIPDNSVVTHNDTPSVLEKHIIYICPKCGTEYQNFLQWVEHIDYLHNYTKIDGLNFEQIPNCNDVLCLECNMVLSGTAVQIMQRHKFSHLPHSATMRCELCRRLFSGRREIIKHLRDQHCVTEENPGNSEWSEMSRQYGDESWDNNVEDNNDILSDNPTRNDDKDMYEPYIEYLCPQCGRDFYEKKQWRRHIIKRHQLTDLKVLNFRVINDRQVQCIECNKIITNAYGVQNAQQHRITHMPYKTFIRCRLCVKAYTDRKGVVKHLRSVHGMRALTQYLSKNEKSRHSLQSRALPLQQTHRPMSSQKLHTPQHSKAPVKEIVQHEQYTYEIKYLDEDDDADAADESMVEADTYQQAESHKYRKRDHYDESNDDNTLLQFDDIPVPELVFADKSENKNDFKVRSDRSKLQIDRQRSNRSDQYDAQRMISPSPSSSSSHKHSQEISQRNADSNRNDDDSQLSSDDALLIPSVSNVASALDECGSSRVDWSNYEQYFSFLCPSCGTDYKTQAEWRHHINNIHHYDQRQHLGFRSIDTNRFQCIQCHMLFVNTKLKGLQEHKFRHLPFKLYIKCELCSTCYNHKPNMIHHLRMRHNIDMPAARSEPPYNQKPPPVKMPTKTYNRNSLGGNGAGGSSGSSAANNDNGRGGDNSNFTLTPTFYNSAVDHETITYFCPQCNIPFDSHINWRKHIVNEHNLNNRQGLNFRQIDEHHFLCLECYKRVTVTHNKGAIGQLQSHKFRHLPHKSFLCTACGVHFVRKQMFFKHLNKKTKRCPSAGKSNISHTNINMSNTRELENSEQDSNMSTNENTSNVDGLNLPSTDDEFIVLCPDCGKQFDRLRPWREHINTIHQLGNRDKLRLRMFNSALHQCIDCREYVTGKKLHDLQAHRFKHLPYGMAYIRCRHCKASFDNMRELQKHLFKKHGKGKRMKSDAIKIELDMKDNEELNFMPSDVDDNTIMTNNTSTTTTTAAVVNESSSDECHDNDKHGNGEIVKNKFLKKLKNESSSTRTEVVEVEDDDDDEGGDDDDSNHNSNHEIIDDDDDEPEFVEYSDNTDEQYLLG